MTPGGGWRQDGLALEQSYEAAIADSQTSTNTKRR